MIKPGMFISDRYEIIEKVGSGGMADVYKARCHRLNRFVAIKVLKAEYNDDSSFIAKFKAEAQSAAGLSHPNIVNVYDVGEDEGLYYIVMELVEGITLKSFIERKGKIDVKEAVGIAVQIAQGLEAAHDNHIIHRDIKPQNIIISREGKVKVTDFGIAKAATSNTITSNAMGSVHYISPEQARGGYSDEKSDIYSLGVTMYEMLTGRVPFAGDNTVSVALLHIQEEAVPIRELEPGVPPSIDKIVQKCMQKKAERRYLSATALIADLKKALANPAGDFVKIPAAMIVDSPTINLSEDEVARIKTAANKKVDYDDEIEEPYEDEQVEEKESDEDVDPKLEKAIMIGSITAAIILGAIVIFLVAKLFGFFSFGKKSPAPSETPVATESIAPTETPELGGPVTVINVVGLQLEDAKKKLEDLKLYVLYDYKETTEYDEGIVIEQEFESGTELKENDTIHLVVSSGPQSIIVPDVYGKSQDEAISSLAASKLPDYKPTYEYSDTVENGFVIRTSPERNSSVAKGSVITIVISQGPDNVKVPKLEGKTEQEALDALEEVGLKGKASYKNSTSVKEGIVITQDYTEGSSVEKGKTINFTVSLGPEEDLTEYVYRGTVTIDSNPFTEEDESGNITITLTQGDQDITVYDGILSYSDFPYRNLNVEGVQEGNAIVKMYLNGELCPGTWNVRLKKEAK